MTTARSTTADVEAESLGAMGAVTNQVDTAGAASLFTSPTMEATTEAATTSPTVARTGGATRRYRASSRDIGA